MNETYLRVWAVVAERSEALGLSGLWRGSGEDTALAWSTSRKTGLILPFSMQSQVFEILLQPGWPILGFAVGTITLFHCSFRSFVAEFVALRSFRASKLFLSTFFRKCRGTSCGPGTLNTPASLLAFSLTRLLSLETTPFFDRFVSLWSFDGGTAAILDLSGFRAIDFPSRDDRGLDIDQNLFRGSSSVEEDEDGDSESREVSGLAGCWLEDFWETLGIRGAHTGQEGDL